MSGLNIFMHILRILGKMEPELNTSLLFKFFEAIPGRLFSAFFDFRRAAGEKVFFFADRQARYQNTPWDRGWNGIYCKHIGCVYSSGLLSESNFADNQMTLSSNPNLFFVLSVVRVDGGSVAYLFCLRIFI